MGWTVGLRHETKILVLFTFLVFAYTYIVISLNLPINLNSLRILLGFLDPQS